MRTLELGLQDTITGIAGNMETVSMWIADQYVAGIWDVNAVRETGDLLITDAVLEGAVLVENGNTVPLEVANIKIVV